MSCSTASPAVAWPEVSDHVLDALNCNQISECDIHGDNLFTIRLTHYMLQLVFIKQLW